MVTAIVGAPAAQAIRALMRTTIHLFPMRSLDLRNDYSTSSTVPTLLMAREAQEASDGKKGSQ